MSNRLHIARVRGIAPLSNRVSSVTLEVEEPAPFHFEPGQYISLHLDENGEESIRHYSIASPPAPDNRIELCIADPAAVAATDPRLPRTGQRLRFSGPCGAFRLREPIDRDVLFVATGTGVSPLRPMLHRALGAGTGAAITLLFGARSQGDVLYAEELADLARRDQRFRFLPTLSRPTPGWTGLTGHVQTHLDRALGGRTALDIYLCGHKEMIGSVRRLLAERGVDPKHVHQEKSG